MSYPQHEKLSERGDEHAAICGFLEWLGCGGRFVGEWNDDSRANPIGGEEILAEFFDVDVDALEAEKREMLRRVRGEADGGGE